MPSLFKIAILATCAAGGIGVAVALGLNPAPAKESAEPPAVSAAAPAASAPSIAASSPSVPSTAAPVMESAQEPQTPRAEQSSQVLAAALDQVKHVVEQQGNSFEQALSAMTERLTPPPPTATHLAAVLQEPAPEALPPVREPLPAVSGDRISRGEGDHSISLNVQNSDIRAVLETLSEQGELNILASASVQGNVTASLRNVDIGTALSAILKSTGFVARREGDIIYVGKPADMASMDQTVDRILTRVYRPNYITAAEIQKLFTPLLSKDVGSITVSSPAEVDIQADQVKTGGDNFAGEEVVVVRDYETVLAELDQLFANVDIRPKQVAIEAMILSVSLSDEFKFGVNFEALRDQSNVRLISGTPGASLATLTSTEGGLKFGFLDSSLGLFVNALETVGDTNVIASPRLTCLNKQRAEIQIGEELGYVNTTVTETSSTQSISFLDTGTLLRIRPYITSDGIVRLEVHPELSTGSVDEKAGMAIPNKSVTQVTTNVMCPDGCTVVIGGLIREDLQTNTSQIPLLGNLPWLGPAFRQKIEKVNRNEVIVLITPRIVSEPSMHEEAIQYGNEFAQRQNVYFDKMSPIGKRNYANHYLRLARAAYAAGDYRTALTQVNMAIHFDPENRDSINLRNEIVAAGGFEEESIHQYLHQGLRPLGRTRPDYSKQGYPWKEFEGFSPEVHVEGIHNPGSPGPSQNLERPQPLVAELPLPGQQPGTLPQNRRAAPVPPVPAPPVTAPPVPVPPLPMLPQVPVNP
jgi:type IV pilus assembly protein PilQ